MAGMLANVSGEWTLARCPYSDNGFFLLELGF
jgi:hypothetical protein